MESEAVGKLSFDPDGVLNTFPTKENDENDNLLDNMSDILLNPEMCTKEGQRRISESRRFSISASDTDEDPMEFKKLVIQKTKDEFLRIQNACNCTYLFSNLNQVSKKTVHDALQEVKVKGGDTVIKEGDHSDRAMLYIVDQGTFEVFSTEGGEKEEKINEYVGKGCFGELSLLYGVPRSASVVAATDGILWGLDRTTFRHVIVRTQAEKRRKISGFLNQVPLLSNLTEIEIHQISDVCEIVIFNHMEYVFTEKDKGDRVYFVKEGLALCTSHFQGQEREIGRVGPGGYFGERSILLQEPRAANIKVWSDTLMCYSVDAQNFLRLIRKFDLHDALKRQMDSYQPVSLKSPTLAVPDLPNSPRSRGGFEISDDVSDSESGEFQGL